MAAHFESFWNQTFFGSHDFCLKSAENGRNQSNSIEIGQNIKFLTNLVMCSFSHVYGGAITAFLHRKLVFLDAKRKCSSWWLNGRRTRGKEGQGEFIIHSFHSILVRFIAFHSFPLHCKWSIHRSFSKNSTITVRLFTCYLILSSWLHGSHKT